MIFQMMNIFLHAINRSSLTLSRPRKSLEVDFGSCGETLLLDGSFARLPVAFVVEMLGNQMRAFLGLR